jgi:hypothetical protein
MADTQRDDGTAGPTTEVRIGRTGRRRSRVPTGCRGGWTAPGPPTAGAQRSRLFGPRFWLLLLGLLTSVLVELRRIKRGDPRARRSRTDHRVWLESRLVGAVGGAGLW